MNFLELCQAVALESGTIPTTTTLPSTVVGQTGRLGLVVSYVRQAWNDIQNAHRAWRWMQGEFTGVLTIGVDRYAGTDFTDVDTLSAITRFSQWGFRDDDEDTSVSTYLTSAGVAYEGSLRSREWEHFRQTFLRGTQTAGPPAYYSITPAGELIVGPVPDASYTINGPYRKSAQTLAANSDIPEMPVDFHSIIKDRALNYLEAYDEGVRIQANQRLRELPNWSMLENQQLPRLRLAGPLA